MTHGVGSAPLLKERTTMTIARFKACPKCQKGDVALNRDFFGWYVQCLQCGYLKDVSAPEEAELVLKRPEGDKELIESAA